MTPSRDTILAPKMQSDGSLVEFWRCLDCNKRYLAPPSTFELIAPFLAIQSKGKATVVLVCEGCNALRSYGSNDIPPPRMIDIEHQTQFVGVDRAFRGQIACADKNCEALIEIIVLTKRFVDADVLRYQYSPEWKANENVHCEKGHPPASPIILKTVDEIG